jgi:hypothetical protein
MNDEDAITKASARDDLDPTLLVAPLYFLSEIKPAYHNGIDRRIGYFHIRNLPGLPGSNLVADLHQMTTVDHRLIKERIVSHSERSVGILRFKLAELFAYRALSSLSSLDNLVGRKVVGIHHVETSNKKKETRVTLELDDGTKRILDIRTPEQVAAAEEIVRQPARRPAPPQSKTSNILSRLFSSDNKRSDEAKLEE